MTKLELKLDKNKKYVVACSFGPDSMALLSSAIENNLNIVVTHVNYRKREAAVFEQEQLETYCKDRNISIYVLDLLGKEHKGNFQNWARETRYKFFKEVVEKEHADAVLVAHQQDDLIETYLMQKNRGNLVKFVGIPEKNELFGVKIVRPLLGYSKHFLQEFNDKNNIPYSIDQSNLTDAYTRNKIRHHVVEKLSETERQKILEEVKNQNIEHVDLKTVWNKEEFLELTYGQIVKLLDYFMNKTEEHSNISRKYVDEIRKAFRGKVNCHFDITNKLRLELDYDEVYLVNKERVKKYDFAFTSILKNEIFDIDFRNGAVDRKIPENETNLIVKNIPQNTNIIIKNYTSQINRLFIDWKMPHFLREVWPGIYNDKNELLYVPRYRKNFKDNHKSKFVFRTEYFTKF